MNMAVRLRSRAGEGSRVRTGAYRGWLIVPLCLVSIPDAQAGGTPWVETRSGTGVMIERLKATKPGGSRLSWHNSNYLISPPRMVSGARRLQCVPYARELSKVQIFGDASTWWRSADGRYKKGRTPELGAVLVFKSNGRSNGHLAVVVGVAGPRVIIANHANWLRKGLIHRNTSIQDVSGSNDWSAVKVWYTPGNRYGAGTYRTYGFIYPDRASPNRRLSALGP